MNNRQSAEQPGPGNLVNDLAFAVENLGVIRQGHIKPKPLTLFCGPNNSSKTWAMYSLYHCYDTLRMFFGKSSGGTPREHLPKPKSLDEFNRILAGGLPNIFNVSPIELREAHFTLDNADLWSHITENDWDQCQAFLMPAERNGLHLFFRELSNRRTALLHHASKESIDISELLRDVIRSPYASPIADYINWLNGLFNRPLQQSEHFHDFAERVKKDLAGGAYRVDRSTGSITFKPYQKKRDGKATPRLDLHVTSSNVKSLFGLWTYLEHDATPGDILMIDEPELNIHPENQREIARLLARLVNAGLRVVVSTHSDYIVRELNTLIMLHHKGAEPLRGKYGYKEDEVLSVKQVAAYLFDDGTIRPFEITPDDGIYADTFDTVIHNLNDVNNDIYYTLQEQRHEEQNH